jgi:RNA polymerase sigma-70 factor (ECF subfamily)
MSALSIKSQGNSLTDEELVARYADGDLRAFEVLYQRHRKPIYNFILRSVHAPEKAEEIMQEVFLRLVQNATGYVRDAKFTTWLYTIARNLCIDNYRRHKNRHTVSLQQSIGKNSDDGTLEQVIEDTKAVGASEGRVFQGQIQEALQSSIEQLSEEQKEVFLLRESAHLSYKEIADIVKVSENTVKSRMRYALEHLRKHMESLGFSVEDTKEKVQ